MAKRSFSRDRISARDGNPWQGAAADSICSEGFREGTAPRVGSVLRERSGKETRSLEQVCADLVERQTGKPVKITLSRDEKAASAPAF